MPRYFFDLVGHDDQCIDAEGLEFPDLAEATKGAQAAAQDLLRDAELMGFPEASDCRYEIYDRTSGDPRPWCCC